MKDKNPSAFDRLAAKLAGRPGVSNPRGLAAAIGRQKYGGPVMRQAAQKGVSAASLKRQAQAPGEGAAGV